MSNDFKSSSMPDRVVLFPSTVDCKYTACYCEENVWQLCKLVQERHEEQLDNCYCVFISNSDQTIPLYCQRSSTREDGLVIWDYHVIFIHKMEDGSLVYDLDTLLDFPCLFSKYAKEGIGSCDTLKPQFHRQFRVIKADLFLKTFASDRSHMFREGKWLKAPPPYPCIKTDSCSNNIQSFIDMDSSVGVGTVMLQREFCDFFTSGICDDT